MGVCAKLWYDDIVLPGTRHGFIINSFDCKKRARDLGSLLPSRILTVRL